MHAYPSSGQCAENAGFTETACLTDTQLQAEIARLVAANNLPTGLTGQAPIYLVVTPPTVNSCLSGNQCLDNYYCAYHGQFSDGASTVLYADIATVLDANQPKDCQQDGNTAVQAPNAAPNGQPSRTVDVALKAMSHEFSETITDPLANAWWDSASGNEDGDNCNFSGAFDPQSGNNPNAFTPTLGGAASVGTLYNQLINGDEYYTQSEWSNGSNTCLMYPPNATLTAAFSASARAGVATPVSFDPGASTSSNGYTSATWNFGDGSTSFMVGAPQTVSHSFSSPGAYTVKLTLVDQNGNLSTVSHAITIPPPPTAAFTFSPLHPRCQFRGLI